MMAVVDAATVQFAGTMNSCLEERTPDSNLCFEQIDFEVAVVVKHSIRMVPYSEDVKL